MRKLALALSVVLLFALCGTALALPGGVQWGMSREEVIECAISDCCWMDAESKNDLWYIDYSETTVSRYTANCALFLSDDRLFMSCYYSFSSNEDSDYNYLKNALSSLYGEASFIGAYEIIGYINPLRNDGGSFRVSDGYKWCDGNTDILLFIFDDSKIHILYFDNTFDLNSIGTYNTTGL